MAFSGHRPFFYSIFYSTIFSICCVLALAGSSAAETTPASTERLTELRTSLQDLTRDLGATEPGTARERIAGLRATWVDLLHLAASANDPDFAAKVEALEPLLWNLERAQRTGAAPPAHLPVVTPWAPGSFGGGNDQCSDAEVLTPGEVAGTTTDASNDGQATCGGSFFSPDVWFAFTPTTSSSFSIDTFGSDFDTVLSIHTGCPGTTSNQIACNDDSFGHASALSFQATAGTTYWIRVSGFDEASGDFQLRLGPGGTVTGVVTDEDTGSALIDGQIRIYDSNGFFERSTTPANDGTYSVTLESGTYFAEASNFADHLDEVYEGIPCARFECEPEEGEPIPVITNETAEGIDFSLLQGGILSGTVTDNGTGQPLAFATVRLYDADFDFVSLDLTAAIDGTYTFGNLLPGTYRVTATDSQYRGEVYDDVPCTPTCDPSSGTGIVVQASTETPGIDLALDQLGAISGTVTRQTTGDPVEGVRVTIRNSNNSTVTSTLTAADGTYQVGGLLDVAGPYFAIASDAGMAAEVYDDIPCNSPLFDCDATVGDPIAVTLDAVTPGIDFALFQQGSLEGTVEDQLSGDLLSGVQIELYNSSFSFQRSTNSDIDGNYTFDNLDAGTYYLRTHAEYGSPYFDEVYEEISCESSCSLSAGTAVAVSLETSTPGIDFTLEQGGSISGQVTREENSLPLSTQVELYDSSGSFVDSDFTSSFDGVYSFVRLPPGDYFLRTDSFGDFFDELYQDIPCDPSCSILSGTPVEAIRGVPTTDIDFALALPPSANIHGVVRDGDGDPLVNVSIRLHDHYGSTLQTVLTSGDGSYIFQEVDFGEYFVRTVGTVGFGDELFDNLPCQPSCTVTAGTPIVVVAEGDILGIDFELEAIGGFQGTVTDAVTGNPLFDYEVEIWDSNGQLVTRAPVGSNGDYQVSVSPGTYYASTMGAYYGSHYLDELWDDIPCPGGAPGGCNPLNGTPILVLGTNVATGIDFALQPPGRITGFVVDQVSGLPISSGEAVIWDAQGRSVDFPNIFNGVYRTDLLPPGEYFVSTHFYYDVNYLEELYPDIPCFGGAPSGCDPTKGEAVVINPGQTTRHIDFDLLPLGGDGGDDDDFDLVGMVTDETGQPLTGVAIDFWAPDGTLETTLYTNGQGLFFRNLFFGDAFYVSTDNGDGLIDEVWENISCPDGSAFEGLCDPTAGALIEEDSSTVFFLEINLASSLPFFADGFESGDTSGWSNASGLVP